MPPLCSIVLMPRGVRRSRIEWPSTSDRTEATWRFDMNRRLVLLLAWLTLLPYRTDLPERAQRRGMALPLKNDDPAKGREGRLFKVPNPLRQANQFASYANQSTTRSLISSTWSSGITRPRAEIPAWCTVSGSPETRGCHQ